MDNKDSSNMRDRVRLNKRTKPQWKFLIRLYIRLDFVASWLWNLKVYANLCGIDKKIWKGGVGCYLIRHKRLRVQQFNWHYCIVSFKTYVEYNRWWFSLIQWQARRIGMERERVILIVYYSIPACRCHPNHDRSEWQQLVLLRSANEVASMT